MTFFSFSAYFRQSCRYSTRQGVRRRSRRRRERQAVRHRVGPDVLLRGTGRTDLRPWLHGKGRRWGEYSEFPRHSFEYFSLKDTEFSLVDVQVRGGYVLHVGNLEGTVKIGDTLKIYIDEVCIVPSGEVRSFTGVCGVVAEETRDEQSHGNASAQLCLEKSTWLRRSERQSRRSGSSSIRFHGQGRTVSGFPITEFNCLVSRELWPMNRLKIRRKLSMISCRNVKVSMRKKRRLPWQRKFKDWGPFLKRLPPARKLSSRVKIARLFTLGIPWSRANSIRGCSRWRSGCRSVRIGRHEDVSGILRRNVSGN